MSIINKLRLEQYLKLNYNVLFSGRHGVGKTMVIKDVFESAGLRWKYFSASTLDPWVDFVGVPKVIDRDGQTYLDLVRPKFIQDDEIDAIFFDELNRAPDKVLNAIMELIQFKSINGHKLTNLKVIWAAINPEDEDDTYSVNHLDPAHVDRFHVKIEVPFDVDRDYFIEKYPLSGQVFIDWWKALPDNIRLLVSPRRLDYAADAFVNDCRLEDFLPVETNVSKLRTMLKSLPFQEQIAKINNTTEAAAFLKNINNATKLLEMVKVKDALAIDFFVKYAAGLPKELVEPFVDYVAAQKAGLDIVSSIEELIEKLPNTEGDANTAGIINNADLQILYKKGGSLFNDLVALNKTKKKLVHKLANRCADVVLKSHGPTLERVFWGIEGKAANKKTNFQNMILLLTRVDATLFSNTQRSVINNKLYTKKIVDAMNFL